MPANQESINRELYGILKSRGYRPDMFSSSGKKVSIPDQAEAFQFDFMYDGKNYGKVTATLDGLHRLIIYYGDDVDDSPNADSPDSPSFTSLKKHLKRFAKNHSLGFELSDEDNLEADMAKREYNKSEGLNESYYPMGKMKSYSDNVPTTKILLQHTRVMQEGEQRFRHIEKIFVENVHGERFLLPTNKPGLARVYARHIAEGGTPYDERGSHITSIVEEYSKMAGFVRATKGKQFNESAQKLINEGHNHYVKLRETLHKMAGKRGYNEYFENYSPALMEDENSTDLSEMFMQSSLDPRIENVMPILGKLSKNITENEVNEIKELEEWADNIIEGKVDESLMPGEYHHYEDEVDPKTGEKKRVYKGIRGDQYQAPSKPYQFPDDSFAKAQRAYDKQIPEDLELTEQFGANDAIQLMSNIRMVAKQAERTGELPPEFLNSVVNDLYEVIMFIDNTIGRVDGKYAIDILSNLRASAKEAQRTREMPPGFGNKVINDLYEVMMYLKKMEGINQVGQQGVAENLDANQKKVGQLGPTEKITKSNPTQGKLVGGESVDPLIRIKGLSGLSE